MNPGPQRPPINLVARDIVSLLKHKEEDTQTYLRAADFICLRLKKDRELS